MEIKKILFISMFSLMCSVNSFTKPLFNENVTKELKETTISLFIGTSFEKNIKKKLEDIEKKYLESHYNHEKKKLIHDKQRIVDDEKNIFYRYNEGIYKLFSESTKNWYNFVSEEAHFALYLSEKYEIGLHSDITMVDGHFVESAFFRKEDYKRILEIAKIIDELYSDNKKTLNLNVIRKTKEEYVKENNRMNKKYDELYYLVKDDIFTDDSSYGFDSPLGCELPALSEQSNGLLSSQREWLEFRENEAQMYFILANKDKGVYYGKLFEITKQRTDYLENVIENIKKSEKYKEEQKKLENQK